MRRATTKTKLNHLIIPLALAFLPAMHAASISFTPPGTQVDADKILDIGISEGQDIQFKVYVDTTGLPANLQKLDYSFLWDPTELTLNPQTAPTPGIQPGLLFTNLYFPAPLCTAPLPDQCGVNAVHDLGNVAPGNFVLLDTITFTTTDKLNNDGQRDFSIQLLSATGVDGTSYYDPSDPDPATNFFAPTGTTTPDYQEVEVQPAESCMNSDPDNPGLCAAPEPATPISMISGLCALLLLRLTFRGSRA